MNTPFFSLGRKESALKKTASFAKDKVPVHVIGPAEAQKAHLIYYLCEELRSGGIVLTQTDAGARQLALDLAFFNSEARHIPASEFSLYQVTASSREARNRKMSVLSSITEKTIGVMSVETLLQFVPDKASYQNTTVHFQLGECVDTEKLPDILVSLGYTRYDITDSPGQFSVRGGILDVFPPSSDDAFRIEFFDNEIDSIRTYDPQTQISVEKIESVTVPPIHCRNEDGCVLSYFPNNTPVFIDEPHAVQSRAESMQKGVEETLKSLLESGAIEHPKEKYMHDFSEIMQKFQGRSLVSFSNLSAHAECIEPKAMLRIPVLTRAPYRMSPEQIKNDISGFISENKGVVLFVKNTATADELASLFDGYGLKCSSVAALDRLPEPGELFITVGALSSGFIYMEAGIAVLTMGVVAERQQTRKVRSKKNLIKDYTELKIGDNVVHRKYGIGRYEGIERIKMDGVTKDYVKIQYRGTDVLYLPASSLDNLSKYTSGNDNEKEVKLSKLGGTEWANSKARVKKRVKEMAYNLVELYAQRKATKGYAFSKDTVWQAEFEASFPYEPTRDQLRCVHEIKQDMEKPYPMDRLLLGDVGFGKTEVAARAAFKAVMDSKQVAILCPTTILAMQHFHTFCARMENYPINIEMLSRFRSKKEQAEIIKKLKKGEIDIIIGTHRIVQNDIEFSDLGLLIIDEEQRFGVAHKEKIKVLQKNVDVLTLSATPIPRSLNMSMIGIRDISIISEPPVDRFPVQTFVVEYNQAVVNDAVIRELDRGGQVYYLHNRVDDIYKVAERLQKNIPDAKIAVGHGKMTETELENVMSDFIDGKTNVLVCTTIIETGLDIQNVNTIIIEDADHYGLSQLYQLRGRVGRTNRLAYAFLTYRQGKVLEELGEKRLRTMREYTEFGSGFKIAMRDLQLRGAGDLLGAEQHGFIANIGYETYCEILEKAVAEIKGEPEEKLDEPETLVDLNINAFIPKNYIAESVFIMEIYRKIAEIRSREDADDMVDELIDRFGDPPKETLDLIEIALIRGMAMKCGIFEIKQTEAGVVMKFKSPDDEMLRKLMVLAAANSKTIRFGKGEIPTVIIRKGSVHEKDLLKYLKNLLKHLQSE